MSTNTNKKVNKFMYFMLCFKSLKKKFYECKHVNVIEKKKKTRGFSLRLHGFNLKKKNSIKIATLTKI